MRLALFLSLCFRSSVADSGFGKVDKTGWVDPSETVFQGSAGQRLASTVPPQVPCTSAAAAEEARRELSACRLELVGKRMARISASSEGCHDYEAARKPLVHLITKLLRKLESVAKSADFAEGEWDSVLKLNRPALDTLRAAVAAADARPDIAHIIDVLDDMLRPLRKRRSPYAPPSLWERVGGVLPAVAQAANVALLFPAALLLLVHLYGRVDSRRLGGAAVVLAFWASVGWNWVRLYKGKQAELAARLAASDVPAACRPPDFSFGRMLWTMLTILPADDPCVQFQKDVHIDPLWEVTPFEAISVTVVGIFVHPLGHLGQGLADFLSQLFGRLHVGLWPLALALVAAGGLVLVVLACGGELSLGFGLARLGTARRERSRPRSPPPPQSRPSVTARDAVAQPIEAPPPSTALRRRRPRPGHARSLSLDR